MGSTGSLVFHYILGGVGIWVRVPLQDGQRAGGALITGQRVIWKRSYTPTSSFISLLDPAHTHTDGMITCLAVL